MDEIKYKVKDIKSDLEFGKFIKSKFIIEEIFSFLRKKKLLNLIIYNKYLQNIYKINIEDYKQTSGKYKEGKKNGIGKIYKSNLNILIFEGEYLNGKKNGKEKKYMMVN